MAYVTLYKESMTVKKDSTNTHVSWLKPGQVEEMRNVAHAGRNGYRDDAIIAVLYDTGLRRGELVDVDASMLDLETGELRIPAGIQKDYPNDNSPDPATFELDPGGNLATVRTLRAHLDGRDDGPLFRSQKGGRLTGKAVNDVVKKCARRADVRPHTYDGRGAPTDVTAHTLRHSVAWRMLRKEGAKLYDVRNRLRHSSILTTEREYDHFETI